MKIHLVDGTYELFRAHFAMPPMQAPDGRTVSAVRGLLRTLLVLLRQEDVSHDGCAFDHVVESFRNKMFAGYKTGEGIPEELLAQFELAERAAASPGIVVWPMVEFEADDAMATAAVRNAAKVLLRNQPLRSVRFVIIGAILSSPLRLARSKSNRPIRHCTTRNSHTHFSSTNTSQPALLACHPHLTR